MVQQVGHLHAACINFTSETFTRGARLTSRATEDSKSQHGGTDVIKAHTLSNIHRRDALSDFLDALIHTRFNKRR